MAKKAPQGSELIFTDPSKHRRALGIVDMLNKRPISPHLKAEYSAESIEELVGKFRAILEDADVKSSNEEAAVKFVYEKLGGGFTTHDRQVKVRAALKKNADSRSANEEANESESSVPEEEETSGNDDDEE